MDIEVNLPNIGTESVEITEIMVRVGDRVDIDQPLIFIESDKSSVEVPSPSSGIVKSIMISVGDKIFTGSIIMIIDTLDCSENLKLQDNVVSEYMQKEIENDMTRVNTLCVHATPLIRRMAREFGINLINIKGTGRKGRILREDVYDYVKKAVSYTESLSVVSSKHSFFNFLKWPKVDFSKFGEIEEIELSRIQKISSVNLHRNYLMLPHVTQFDEIDITKTEEFRKAQNADAKKNKVNIKITILAFVMKVVAKALKEWPRFNSSLSDDGQTLILKKYVNIGVAVDTTKGLLVPVFRNVNNKSIIELSHELKEMSQKASSDNQLTPLDMQGGCFTISNLGGIGGTAFTPIVNVPEVAILGMSKSLVKPVWNGKKFAPRVMLPLSLSYDHRVIDGADGARFIGFIGKMMSDIRYLIM